MPGDPRYHRLLGEMGSLHDRKQEDYGTGEDPFANFTSAKEFGIEPWQLAMLRANEKMHRVKAFVKKGRLANESLRDSLIDIAVCAAIAVVLYDESEGTGEPEGRSESGQQAAEDLA